MSLNPNFNLNQGQILTKLHTTNKNKRASISSVDQKNAVELSKVNKHTKTKRDDRITAPLNAQYIPHQLSKFINTRK